MIEVERAGRVTGPLAPRDPRSTKCECNGAAEDLRTNPVVFEGEATKGEDATKIGVGAGIGAAIGGILGGGDGAAKGAAIGGAAGTGTVLATRGREVELASGTDIEASLATPLDVRISLRLSDRCAAEAQRHSRRRDTEVCSSVSLCRQWFVLV